jgi:Transposase DDE domain group 1
MVTKPDRLARSTAQLLSIHSDLEGRGQANQLRLWFASMAYVLLCALRRIGLAHTQFAEATCGTIRLKLLKLGALVRISVRRIKIAMAPACPWQDEFALAHARLRNAIA